MTTPDIESGSANFTVSLNNYMVDVCTPRQAIFHGSGIVKSIEVDIQLPSCELANCNVFLITYQVDVFSQVM